MSESVTTTGRRKTAVARVTLTPGTGKITINGKSFEEYCPTIPLQNTLLHPFEAAGMSNKYDVVANCQGGGVTGQIGAVKLGIARALIIFDPELRPPLKSAGHMTRDPRAKERKKAGQPGARKRFQFSKR